MEPLDSKKDKRLSAENLSLTGDLINNYQKFIYDPLRLDIPVTTRSPVETDTTKIKQELMDLRNLMVESGKKLEGKISEYEEKVKGLHGKMEKYDGKVTKYEISLERMDDKSTSTSKTVVVATGIVIMLAIAGIAIQVIAQNKHDSEFYNGIHADRTEALLKIQELESRQNLNMEDFKRSVRNELDLFRIKNPKLNY